MARHRPSPRGVGAILALAAGLTFPGCGQEPAGPQALPPLTITLSPLRLTLSVGGSAPLVATVRDSEGRTLTDRMITWASSSPAIAAVSSSGLVTANGVGVARISAIVDHIAQFAGVTVQGDLRLPLAGGQHWLLRTETGTPTPRCSGEEGGLRDDGAWDCTHAGSSRYSLDFAAVTEEEGPLTGVRPIEVLAAADGLVISVCLRPPSEVTCGPNGPSVTVEHPTGFLIIYAHLDPASVTIRRKMTVARGQLIGNMGAWGDDPDAWVHFEFRTDLEGPDSGPELQTLLVDGIRLPEYRVIPDGPRFYRSSNSPRSEPD